MDRAPISPTRTGVSLTLHVQPGARRTELVGRHGDGFKFRVAAPPVDGAANEALIEHLAQLFGRPRAAVRLVGGSTQRRKRVEIDGVEVAEAERRLGR